MELHKLITLDDLTDEQQRVAEIVGLPNYVALTKVFGGTYVYFPTLDGISRPARNRLIQQEFNGANYKDLATKYGVSEITVRRLCDDPNAPLDGQISLI